MESRGLALVLVSLELALVSYSYGRPQMIKLSNPSTFAWREKRQSHPQATIARIPEVAFGDQPRQLVAQVPDLVEYLTPPPPGDSFTAGTQNRQGGVWDLGYDANEVLVPPSDQTRQYDTLKVFSLVPGSREEPLTGLASTEEESEEELPPESSEDFDSPEEEDFRREQRAPQPKGPVYTYVKTDKHGHFKWGVRHGH